MKKIIFLLACSIMLLAGCQKGGNGPGTATLKVSVASPAAMAQKNSKITLPTIVDSLTVTVMDGSNTVASGQLGAAGGDLELIVPADVALSVTADANNGTNLLYSGSGSITLAEGAIEPLSISMTYVGPSFSVGGSVSGLAGSVVLQNNGGGDLTISADGAFTFLLPITFGAPYNITVLTQPAGQTCTVANASGTATANVTNIVVTCAVQTFTIGGTVSGLTGTVVLQNNNGNDLTLSANGAFAFSAPVAGGSPYGVTVLTQPAGQVCTVTNGTGTATANVTNVAVNCVAATFTIGGTVSGLTGTVVLRNNGGDNLSVSANGSFTFATPVASTYSVTVFTQPSGQTCSVASGSGTAMANVTNVTVTCATSVIEVLHYHNGGSSATTATLTVIDPANPTNTSTTIPNMVVGGSGFGPWYNLVETGSYNNVTGEIIGLTTYADVFVANGSIWRKSGTTSGSQVPVQVSDVTSITTGTSSITDLCQLKTLTNYGTPEVSIIYISQAGTDITCNTGDDTYRQTYLGASDTTPSTSIADSAPYVSEHEIFRDASSPNYDVWGALEGSGADLLRYDAAFSNPQIILGGICPCTVNILAHTRSNTLLLQVNTNIYEFNPADNSLSASLYTLVASSPIYGGLTDGNDYYFSQNSGTPNMIWRIPLYPVVGPAAVVIAEESNIVTLDGLTGGYVVYSVLDYGIRSVLRTATNAIAADSNNLVNETPGGGTPGSVTGDTNLMYTQITSGNMVYVNEELITAAPSEYATNAYVVNVDGTGLNTQSDSYWQGFSFDTSISWNVFENENSVHNVDYLVLLRRAAIDAVTDASGTLHTWSANGADLAINLGTIPAGIPHLGSGVNWMGNATLMDSTDSAGQYLDIFFYDMLVPGSLVSVTNDGATTQEVVVGF